MSGELSDLALEVQKLVDCQKMNLATIHDLEGLLRLRDRELHYADREIVDLRRRYDELSKRLIEFASLALHPPMTILQTPPRTAKKLKLFPNGTAQVCYDDGTNSSLNFAEAVS